MKMHNYNTPCDLGSYGLHRTLVVIESSTCVHQPYLTPKVIWRGLKVPLDVTEGGDAAVYYTTCLRSRYWETSLKIEVDNLYCKHTSITFMIPQMN